VAVKTGSGPITGTGTQRGCRRFIFRHCGWVGVDLAIGLVMLRSCTGLWQFLGRA
jgi:hypothetical protein